MKQNLILIAFFCLFQTVVGQQYKTISPLIIGGIQDVQVLSDSNLYVLDQLIGRFPVTRHLTTNNDFSTSASFSGGYTFLHLNDSVTFLFSSASPIQVVDGGTAPRNFTSDSTVRVSLGLIAVNDTVLIGADYSVFPTSIVKITPNTRTTLYSDSNTTINIDRLYFLNGQVGFIEVKRSSPLNTTQLLKTLDGGNTWSVILTDSIAASIVDYQFTDSHTGYVIFNSNELYTTLDGGQTWSIQNLTINCLPNDMSFLNHNLGYISCRAGQVYRTVDGGGTWTMENYGATKELKIARILDSNIVYFYEYDQNKIYKRTGTTILTSIQDTKLEEETITLYPNPSNEYINLEIPPGIEVTNIEIYDANGRLVKSGDQTVFTVSEYENGMYFVKIFSRGGIIFKKFLKTSQN